MRFGVELQPSVRSFLRRECSAEERLAFDGMIEKLCDDPIGNSEPYRDPELSRYMLRFFRFGECLGVFGLVPAKDLILVVECRRFSKKNRGRSVPPP